MRGVEVCVKCSSKSTVIDTRRKKNGTSRRRVCRKCKFRWSTIEITRREFDVLKDSYVHANELEELSRED